MKLHLVENKLLIVRGAVLAFFFVFSACSKSDLVSTENDSIAGIATKATPDDSYFVSSDDVLMLIDILFNKEVKCIDEFSLDSERPLYYVVNLSPEGYAVISGDKRFTPVFTQSPYGCFDLESINKGVKCWINFLSERIESSYAKEINQNWAKDNVAFWESLRKRDFLSTKSEAINMYYIGSQTVKDTLSINGPLLQTEWGQSGSSGAIYNYWNALCPEHSSTDSSKSLVGCGPVAVGQILYYLHNRFGFNVIMPNAAATHGSQSTTFSAAMNNAFISSMPLNISETDSNKIQNARLFLSYLGHKAHANYSKYVTTTVIDTVVNYVFGQTYGIYGSLIPFNAQYLSLSIMNDKPVYIRGSFHMNGHAWVADGCKNIKNTIISYYYQTADTLTEAEQAALTLEDSNYQESRYYFDTSFHMNWGWDGDENGWYDVSPSNWHVPGYNYFSDVKIFWNYLW